MSVQEIALDLIQENEAALRAVDRTSETFIGLRDSIKTHGVLNSIVVSPIADTEPQQFRLVDGLQRFSASQDAGLKSIPAVVREMEEADVYYAQVLANVHRVETKPAQYASHLSRILMGNPTMTMADLASQLSKSETWLSNMLRINKLCKQIKELVDDSKINLTNAQALAKLPEADQLSFLEAAQTESPATFTAKVGERVKAIRQAAREGKKPEDAKFTPTEHLRKLAEVKALRHDPAPIKTAMAQAGASDAVAFTLDFLLQMDPESVKKQEAQDKERREARKEAQKKKSVEAKAKKAEKAKKEAEEARKAYEAEQGKKEG